MIRHISALAFLLAFVLAVPSAMAAKVHFVEEPTVTVDLDNYTVDVTGKIAGLGNKDVVITVEVEGTAEIWVYNPSSKLPPGKNRVPFYDVGETIVRPDAKNGNVVFDLTVDFSDIIDDTLAQTILPNPKWTAEVQNVDVTSVTVTVEQGGKVVLTRTFNP